jgi:hypothetical protein
MPGLTLSLSSWTSSFSLFGGVSLNKERLRGLNGRCHRSLEKIILPRAVARVTCLHHEHRC